MVGLDRKGWDALDSQTQYALRKKARETFFANGADYVIDSMSELPDLISVIEKAA